MKSFVLVLALAVASPASAAWRRVDSSNFIVIGDSSAARLRSIATRFEIFHDTLRRVLGAGATASPVPTVVVVFAGDDAFAPYKPLYHGTARKVGGYAASGVNVNYIAMQDAGERNDRVIFHEYTHIMVANAVAAAPVWVNEGLAEFYSTFALTDGGRRAEIGRPLADHLRLLNGAITVPVAELLKVSPASPLYNEQDTSTFFYAESWALMHMLITAEPSRVTDLNEYLRRVNDGIGETEAWEQVFGTAKIENELRRYLARPVFSTVLVDLPEAVAALPMRDVPISPAGAAAFLASLQLRGASADAAAKVLEPALKAEPSDAMANAVMAEIDLARNDAGAATSRLMALGAPDDWFAAYRMALVLATAVDRQGDARGPDAVVARVRRLLDQVRRHAELPNALAALARIELDDDGQAAAREYVARARTLAPGRIDYALLQAQIFAEGDDFASARAVVGPLMTPAYPEQVRDSARQLMAGLVELEKGRGAPAATGGRDAAPRYRELRAGEQRLDGTLERIDCAPPGQPAVFHVRTAAGAVTLEGRLDAIDLIAYRRDLAGGINCGEREPLHVLVAWRDGTSSRHEKVVVAVEFLPKD